jgi:hypothetical protein
VNSITPDATMLCIDIIFSTSTVGDPDVEGA